MKTEMQGLIDNMVNFKNFLLLKKDRVDEDMVLEKFKILRARNIKELIQDKILLDNSEIHNLINKRLTKKNSEIFVTKLNSQYFFTG